MQSYSKPAGKFMPCVGMTSCTGGVITFEAFQTLSPEGCTFVVNFTFRLIYPGTHKIHSSCSCGRINQFPLATH